MSFILFNLQNNISRSEKPHCHPLEIFLSSFIPVHHHLMHNLKKSIIIPYSLILFNKIFDDNLQNLPFGRNHQNEKCVPANTPI